MKRFLLSFLLIALLIWPLLAEAPFVQQNDLSMRYDLSVGEQSYLTQDYNANQAAYEAVLAGVLGITDLNADAAYYTFSLESSNPEGFYFTTPTDVNAKIPYKIQLVPRGGKYRTWIIIFTYADDVYPFIKAYSNGTLTGTNVRAQQNNLPLYENLDNMESFCYLKIENPENSTQGIIPTLTMWRKTERATEVFEQLHVDVIVLVDQIESLDDVAICDDYTASFTIKAQGFNLSGNPVGTAQSATMLLHGYYLTDTAKEAEEAGRSSFFDVQRTQLATYYDLSSADNRSNYSTVATVKFISSTVSARGSSPAATSLDNVRYAIVLSSEPTADSNATPFRFTYTKDLSKTIDYYVRMVGTTDSSLFTQLVSGNQVYFTNTSTDLTGTEPINLGSLRGSASLNATRRYVLVPELNQGTKDNYSGATNTNYYTRYIYEGDIQIKLPSDLNPSEHPAGLYTTNIYVTLISL